jgi:hypothetical protein
LKTFSSDLITSSLLSNCVNADVVVIVAVVAAADDDITDDIADDIADEAVVVDADAI